MSRKPKPAKYRPQGACFKKKCRRKSVGHLECLTCEKLAAHAKIKVDEIHTVHACDVHWTEGVAAARKHALTGHPANILRAVGAALKGEEVF